MKDHLHLHFIVLLFGFTAILGKLISLGEVELVGYRMGLAALGMLGVLAFFRTSINIDRKAILMMLGTGVLVALHWITFFGAIKVSNVSVPLGCMASATLFTSLLEPLFEKRRIYWIEVVLGLLIIVGLYIIFQFAFEYYWGIIYALISAFLASLFGVINRQFILQGHKATVISFYEMVAGFSVVCIYLLATGSFTTSPLTLQQKDLLYLLVLAWICTTYAFVASAYLLKRLTAFTVSLAINLEPIYGIILAILIFGESEHMHRGFYVGALIIISSIIVYPFLRKRFVEKE